MTMHPRWRSISIPAGQMGIVILPPDVNSSEIGFSVEEGKIRYGLSAIKSVGRPGD